MGNFGISLFIVVVFVLFIFYYSQKKFQNKMLCYFIRPNKQRIKKWVPLQSKYVVFDRGKYGIGHYDCDPDCITMEWYTGGINKFFPILIPTLEFKWDTSRPQNPKTFESTWQTPEARAAAWEEHEHIAYAKAAAAAHGIKSRFPEWLFPLILAGLIIVVLLVLRQGLAGLDHRIFDLEQTIKLLQ